MPPEAFRNIQKDTLSNADFPSETLCSDRSCQLMTTNCQRHQSGHQSAADASLDRVNEAGSYRQRQAHIFQQYVHDCDGRTSMLAERNCAQAHAQLQRDRLPAKRANQPRQTARTKPWQARSKFCCGILRSFLAVAWPRLKRRLPRVPESRPGSSTPRNLTRKVLSGRCHAAW